MSSALVVGSTGLVGTECLRVLAEDAGHRPVVALTRRPLPGPVPPGVTERLVSFDRLEEHRADIRGDHVFCALGTTIGKAGSKERFRQVDYDLPLTIARLALENGARHFSLVSAVGADPDSRVFYNRVKGELERDIRALGYPSLVILRPSVLAGERTERRPMEALGRLLLRLVPGRYHPVHARAVAATMALLAREEAAGVRVVESEEIRQLGG